MVDIRAAFVLALLWLCPAATASVFAQSTSAPPKPRPWSRVSFFTNSSQITANNGDRRSFTELSTSFSYQLPESDDAGADYGIDVRYATYRGMVRPERTSLYQAFAGARMAHGQARFRVGHLFLNDVGSLGALAGGLVEYRQPRGTPEVGRFRIGGFAGLEPNILDIGYAPHVKKYGAFLGFDAAATRRHSLGYVTIKNGSLTERTAITANNLLPIGPRVFIYQAAEYNVTQPAGMARRGFAYFMTNARVTPNDRVELQLNYNRGRSIDARGLGEDVLNGRPVTQLAVDGLLYESIGGRATVEVLPRVRIYAGYSSNRNNRDASASGRVIVGGYAPNAAGSGLDLTASDSMMQQPSGSYHSRYVSVGRQLGRLLYLTGDYSTSLSVVRFSRSDGIRIETRPHTTRFSAAANAYLTRTTSMIATIERTNEDELHEVRVLAGLTYRIK